jgi:ABC-type Zn uptake system ZnuABC Zn-binding protein ZnuA
MLLHERSPLRFAVPLALLSLPATAAPARAADRLQVVTTTSDLAAIAREVGGDRVEVLALAAGFQDPHFVDAKPSFLLRLQKADLFVEVGLELESGWAPQLLENSRNARIQRGGPGFVDASEGVRRLNVPGAVDRSAGDIHPYGNPHYWLDPANGHRIAANVARGLGRVDPANAAAYAGRLAAFDARLDEALSRWRESAARLRDLPVVAYHDSWPYFAERFGLRITGFVEPKPGIPPSGRYVAELAEAMKRDGIRIVLMSTFYDQKTANLLAKLSGARVVTLANSVDGLPEAKDYVALFDTNLDRLLAAAKGETP